MAPKEKLKDLQKLYADRWNYPSALKPAKIKYLACGKKPNYEANQKIYAPCWISPGTTANVQFGPCWDYPPERYRRYPPPPPCRGATLPDESLLPKFDKCKTFYTRYDYRLEECVHQQVLIVEGMLKDMEVKMSAERELQIGLAKQMRYHAMRRQLLVGSACGIKIYPEYLSQMAEERALCEFQKAYNELNESNDRLTAQLVTIRDAMVELRSRFDKLDQTLESPYTLNLKMKWPTLYNVIKWPDFDVFQWKDFLDIGAAKTWAQLIDVSQVHSIEDYLALLRSDFDLKCLKLAGEEHCTCKRCRNDNPLDPYLPCWFQGRDRSDKNFELVFDDNIEPKRTEIPQNSSDSDFAVGQSDTSLLQAQLDKLSDE